MLDLLSELYITFLYLLYNRIFESIIFKNNKNQQYFQHILYSIYVFGEDSFSSALNSIMGFCKSVIEYFHSSNPVYQEKHLFLGQFDEKIKEVKNIISSVNIPQNNLINETITDRSIPWVNEINKFGSEIHSNNLQKSMQKHISL